MNHVLLTGLLLILAVSGSVAIQSADYGRAKATLNLEELLKLQRQRREDQDKLSINSPRGGGEDGDGKGKAEEEEDIHIRLPDNISEQMARGHRERSRLRDAILGFPLLEDEDEGAVTEDVVTTEPSSPSTTTTFEFESSGKIDHPQQPHSWNREESSGTSTTEESRYTPSSVDTTRHTTIGVGIGVGQAVPKSGHRTVWAIAWEAHIYFSGTLFVLLAIYCSVNIMRLHTFSRLFSRGYFVSLNLCLVAIGLLRPVWLFHDPYNESLSWPRPAAYILVDTGLPCMTTAFAVLFLALLRATQIELVSPSFQTPRSLGIFCILHFLLSIGVDVTIGMFFNLRYMVLILQGVFIVWSLLLSAGYFYIFSAMNKVAMRQQGDLIRSVYPKLILEGGTAYSEHGQMQPLSTAVLKRPPLARAVHLTLGVAVLGSLLGGIQLFAMIKMLGLIKQDMSASQNEWAWYGYQVSMRVLEVTLCTLLAVIATTPLRSDVDMNQMAATANGIDNREGGDNKGSSICCCFGRRKKKQKRQRQMRRHTRCLNCCCPCLGDSNPPLEFEDEIYSEICSNNHSVRQVLENNPYSTMGRGIPNGGAPPPPGTMLPLGTLNNPNSMMAMGSNTLMPYHKRVNAATGYPSQSATLLRSSTGGNHFGMEAVHPHRTGSGGVQGAQVGPNGSSTSSRATLDTALYSNVRSRPSSMLFNDSGFVRFRMGGDPSLAQVEVLNQSSHNLANGGEGVAAAAAAEREHKKREGLRASQSFDESVLLVESDHRFHGSKASPNDPPQQEDGHQSPIYHTASDPGHDDADDIDPELEAIYEPPPGAKVESQRPKGPQEDPRKLGRAEAQQPQTTPSESDEPQYSGRSQYSRAPSVCSSVSATQSFDMRMYGRIPKGVPPAAQQIHMVGSTGTLKKNEETRERLENPYYYYGSTRNQKKSRLLQQQQKPRPLLPSQRAALEMQQRAPAFVANQLPGERPKSRQQQEVITPQPRPPSRPGSRQALLQQELLLEQQQQQMQLQLQMQQQQQLQQLQQQQELQAQNFQRSRSLGHYYQQQGMMPPQQQHPVPAPPTRNQHNPHHPASAYMGGSMTPVSYAKWQHSAAAPRRYNPLYDTPPTQRHAMMNQPPPPRPQGLNMGEIRGVMGTESPIMRQHLMPHGRNGRAFMTEPVLSPILTDTEISPLHRTGMGSAPDYLTDPSDSDDADNFTSQATQGYSEGLADNELESEVSSIFGAESQILPTIPDLTTNGQDSHVVSPLEYSAMLKLYGSTADTGGGPKAMPQQPSTVKDVTPDSGVVADNGSSGQGNNNNSNSNSNKSTTSSSGHPKKTAKVNMYIGHKPAHNRETSSQNSLLSSSSSTNDAVMATGGGQGSGSKMWAGQPKAKQRSATGGSSVPLSSSTNNMGKEYSRLNAAVDQPETVFSSSASSSGSEDNLDRHHPVVEDTTSPKEYHPLGSPEKSAYRWDGTPLEHSQQDVERASKGKIKAPVPRQRSIDDKAPVPPKRESSVNRTRREEIK